MKLVISNGKSDYVGDVLLRVYPNQSKRPKANENFCYEVLTRNGALSQYAGRYTSEHPQGVRRVAEMVIKEFKHSEFCVEISNEWNDPLTSQYYDWFESMGKSLKSGLLMYDN